MKPSDVQIEKNIIRRGKSATPERDKHSGWVEVIERMEIGDSFIMPPGVDELRPVNAALFLDRFGEVDTDLTGVRRFWRTA